MRQRSLGDGLRICAPYSLLQCSLRPCRIDAALRLAAACHMHATEHTIIYSHGQLERIWLLS